MRNDIKISDFDYSLPEDRIAKFPVGERDGSRLLVCRRGNITENMFHNIQGELPDGATLVFNNTKVIRARILMHKESGAKIEIFCLEPHRPADYERAFSIKESCQWCCIIGNVKKWKADPLFIDFDLGGTTYRLTAERGERIGMEHIVTFRWNADITFGELLELLGRIPIPPYLGRETEDIDYSRYQTIYSRFDGSVAAPTAGLHFTPELIDTLRGNGFSTEEVTLHVGAGTFLPVKTDDPLEHPMHTEHFEITADTIRGLIKAANTDGIVAVGTTTVRTIESLSVLGYRIRNSGSPSCDTAIGQWEAYDIPEELTGACLMAELLSYMEANDLDSIRAATRIMIMPGFRFRLTSGLITNFHQPKSTLLLLVSAFIGDNWRKVYDYAMSNDFRFLSYGDSSLLIR